MVSIKAACQNYFTGFQDLKTPGKRIEGALKCVSYCTLVIPIGVGITLGITSLAGRGTIIPPPISKKVNEAVSISIQPKKTKPPVIISLGDRRIDISQLNENIPLKPPAATPATTPTTAPSPAQNAENAPKEIVRVFGPEYPLLNTKDHTLLTPNKIVIINKAKKRFEELDLKSNFTLHQYSSNDEFRFKRGILPHGIFKPPMYFFNKIPNPKTPPETPFTPAYYDYGVYDPNKENIWVDFANMWLGGGVLNEGNVQEETMAQETPELLAVCADADPKTKITYQTRTKSKLVMFNPDICGEEAMMGNPTPILIKGVHRVLALDSEKLYGHKLETRDQKEIEEGFGITILEQPVKYNLLAIAAPRLDHLEQQFDRGTINDLFNTIYAGFSMADKNCMVHSGLLGCGAFNNHPTVAIVLQMFAAHLQGVSLYLHGVNDQQMNAAKEIWTRAFKDAPDNMMIRDALDKISRALKFKPLDLADLTSKAQVFASDSRLIGRFLDIFDDSISEAEKQAKIKEISEATRAKLLVYIESKLNDPEFAVNPHAYVEKMRKARGNKSNICFPQDDALFFFEKELGMR